MHHEVEPGGRSHRLASWLAHALTLALTLLLPAGMTVAQSIFRDWPDLGVAIDRVGMD